MWDVLTQACGQELVIFGSFVWTQQISQIAHGLLSIC